jgi:hypothetical protein
MLFNRIGTPGPIRAVSGLINGCLNPPRPRPSYAAALVPARRGIAGARATRPKNPPNTNLSEARLWNDNGELREEGLTNDLRRELTRPRQGQKSAVAQRCDEPLPTRQAPITPRNDQRAPVNPLVTLAEARLM